MLNIAIVDDGVNEKLYNIGALLHNIEIMPDLEICQRVDYNNNLLSHGTTCAAIIKKYASEAKLSSVKILNEYLKRGAKDQLVKAFDWCLNNDINIINVSLGTIDYRDFDDIKAAVDRACEKGLIIVAACNNRNIYTYPASLPNVIGVKCDISNNLEEGEFIYDDHTLNGIEITACSKHIIIMSSGDHKTTGFCNSFAAPMITAIIHNIIMSISYTTQKGIRKILKQRSSWKRPELHEKDHSGRTEKNINVPVILIYDFLGDQVLDIVDNLTEIFRKDGYYAVSTAEGDIRGRHFKNILPIGKYIYDTNRICEKCLKVIEEVYDPDIIIAGIDACKYDDPFSAEQYIDVDIRLLIQDISDSIQKCSYVNNIYRRIQMQDEILRMDINARLKRLFREYFDKDIGKYTESDLDKELLGNVFMFAARDLLNLFFDIEKEFGITIPEEDIAEGKFNTYNNILDIIYLQKKEREVV